MITRRTFIHTLTHSVGGLLAGSLLPGLRRSDAPFDVYFTLDDGPTSARDFKSGATDRALDILRDKKAPSTFFLHGRAINDWEGPTLVRYLTEGHAIGNHLWRQGGNTVDDNPSWSLMARQYIEAEQRIRQVLQKADSAAYERYLAAPRLFRRPGGNNGLNDFLNPKNLENIRVEPYVRPVKDQIDWLKDVYDYSGWHVNGGESIPPIARPTTPDAERAFIFSGGYGYYGVEDYLIPKRSVEADQGLIILMHDADANTLAMLPRLIDDLRGRGATFRALPRPGDRPNTRTVGIGYAPTYAAQ